MLNVEGTVSTESNILPNIHRPKNRIHELAQPKENKKIWQTSFGKTLYWGTEDMMWPVSSAALKARPNQRLMELATAKKNFQLGTNRANKPIFAYSCGTTSQIWDVNKLALKANASKTIQRLATPKHPPTEYLENRIHSPFGCGRASPLWPVKSSALSCPSRPRTAKLATPKPPHKDYEPCKPLPNEITPDALKRVASARIEELSLPKSRNDGPFVDARKPEDSLWKVTFPARSASASPRILELAKFKTNPEGYISNRGVQWPVSRSAKRAVPTPRNEELAKPKIREAMGHLQFNPNAFFVSPAAMKARCSPRVEELAHPIQR